MATFKFGDFCLLDESAYGDYLIHSMDVMTALPSIKRIKEAAIEFMMLKSGDIVLEAGCGASIDAELIANKVGPSGKVIGIDSSKKMLALAKERKNADNIFYQLMDVRDMNYGNGYFSACHADRLFVSHADYKALFNELVRVVKKGGVICVTDVDAEAIIISPEVSNTEVILKEILSGFVNKKMGRQLLNLFIDKNMKSINISTNLCEITDFDELCQIFDFDTVLLSCMEKKLLTKEEADEWRHTMREDNKRGAFYYCATFFTVSGVVS